MAAFKCGDVRADGYIFFQYKPDGNEQWYSPQAYHRARLNIALNHAKRRASKSGVAFSITVDHLSDIFPKDGICPALGTRLQWGSASGLDTSPSLDRIDPTLGYVAGNVRWLSQLANQIKTNATTAQVCAVAEFLRKNDYR